MLFASISKLKYKFHFFYKALYSIYTKVKMVSLFTLCRINGYKCQKTQEKCTKLPSPKIFLLTIAVKLNISI